MSQTSKPRYVVLVRDREDNGYTAYGIFHSRASASSFADRINVRLGQADPDVSAAWAYVQPMRSLTSVADVLSEAGF